MKSTTILEIAKTLNLSSSTVSRALKDHPDVSPETKAKVLEIAKKLDYEPNLFAVSLRKDDSKEIAIIAPMLSGFFYEAFITAVEAESKELGYTLIVLLSGDDPEVELQNLKTCKQRRVACIMICVTSRTSDQVIAGVLSNYKIPIIFFDKIPGNADAKFVISDDKAAAVMAAKALLHKGVKRILSVFGDPNFSITKERLEAYVKTFDEARQKDIITIVHAPGTSETEHLVLNAFKSSIPPKAIFCMSDEILIGAMKAIQLLKLSIPADVSVIAISNGFFPKLYFPEITYVETSGHKLGNLAMKQFIAEINHPGSPMAESMLQPLFVAGGSL